MATSSTLTLPDTSKELTEAVKQSLWTEAITLLPRLNCTDQQRRWVFEEILKKSPYLFTDRGSVNILKCCAKELLDHMFSCSVQKKQWMVVDRMMQRNISRTQHRWAVKEGIKQACDTHVCFHIIPHCAEKDIEDILRVAVYRKLWDAVGQALERGVSNELRRWAVEECLLHATEEVFDSSMFHHCLEDDFELVSTHRVGQGHWKPVEGSVDISRRVLSHMMSQGLWKAVGQFLRQNICSHQSRWVLEQAVEYASDDDLVFHIIPHCHPETLEHVITHLVSRRLWWSVDHVLDQGVSTARHKWIVGEALKYASEEDFTTYLLSHCSEEELEDVLVQMVSRGLWTSVDSVKDSRVSVTQHVFSQMASRGLWEGVSVRLERYRHTSLHRWAIAEAAHHAGDDAFTFVFLSHCNEDDIVAVFPVLVAKKMWRSTKRVLHDMAYDALCTWITTQCESKKGDVLFWKFISTCRVDVSMALDLSKAVIQEIPYRFDYPSMYHTGSILAKHVSWPQPLCQTLVATLLHTLHCVMCSDDGGCVHNAESTNERVLHIYSCISDCIKNNTNPMQLASLQTIQNWTPVFKDIADAHKSDPTFHLHFLQGLNLYHVSRRGQADDTMFLAMLAILPLFPQVQSVALKLMLSNKRWDILGQVCLSHLWEHDQRQLFKAAVEQRQWRIVRQWVDHAILNDQRDWAMKEAFKSKEWQVYLLLADHGLTMQEHMHACYIVAKYGDWDTVLQMVERGGDITEVSNLLENWVTGNLRKTPQGDSTVYFERCKKLIKLRLHYEQNSERNPVKALQRGMWGSVLFNILHVPLEDYFVQVLNKALAEKEWHILMHLVRLGMSRSERNQLFPEMVTQQQWGVCRKLLEIGVDVQLCLEALSELLDKNQWTLVARVMEYNIDDSVRYQVLRFAFQRRAGMLFWHCLTTSKNTECFPAATVKTLFYQAISRDIWQAIKPLVEDQDDHGVLRRDLAFLEAIEQHLWDVVDHCQLLGADINMKDDEGETPLHREVRKKEWKAVEEIIFRDGMPNLLNKNGFSVLNRLIEHRQWDTVKMVIKYGGDIHLPANSFDSATNKVINSTPLQRLIDFWQSDVIDFTVKWCSDQQKGVNRKGETTLHAACCSERWDVMDDLIMRKVDPLAVTKTGQTALVYAALNGTCPQRMVGECCRLGFSTHQPSVSSSQRPVHEASADALFHLMASSPAAVYFDFMLCHKLRNTPIASPLVCALVRDVQEVVLMLYESGSASMQELFAVFTQLMKFSDTNEEEGRKVREYQQGEFAGAHGVHEDILVRRFARFKDVVEKYTAFTKEVATNPRTLLSSCRIHISHHFRGKRRLQQIDELPLPKVMKNFLEFSDFRDPDYGKDLV